MRMLRVLIDDFDFLQMGFSRDEISFSELKEKITIGYAKESLLLREINAEIQAVRSHAVNCY